MRRLLLFLLWLPLFGAEYDWLVRNARVVDGTGNPWYLADVAVKDGKIAAIGDLTNAEAGRIVDAAGKVLAPGFIDVHTHVERTLQQVPGGDNFVLDGVTTIVTGNCGGSKVDLAAWFRELEEMGLGLNVASLIGHNSVRREAMGAEQRAPTPEELARMQALIEEAMRGGAVGLSTGLIYVPGTYADTAEIVALAKVAARYGGVYATHMRNEGEQWFDAIDEAVAVGREAEIPVQISHFKVSSKNAWGWSGKGIALVEKARREGIDVVVDQYPYDRSSTGLSILLPSWALAGGENALKERLADPETRARIAQDMEEVLRQRGQEDYSFAMVARFEADPALEGKTVSDINHLRGRDKTVANEVLTVMEMVNQGGASMVYHNMSMDDVERILRYRNTAVASDGGTIVYGDGKPHPRSYGTNARVLARFVGERGTLTLEDAVRRMTSLPARTFGFRDRGLIVEGFAADLVLFDPDLVEDKATFEDPHQYSTGFELVLVNGQAVVENEKVAGSRPGKILRRRFTGHETVSPHAP
jgi:N-acyl-D-amino-acid deacylase